jgi:hypothetical protein
MKVKDPQIQRVKEMEIWINKPLIKEGTRGAGHSREA